MKEAFKDFILKMIGKWPDDPCDGIINVCQIVVVNRSKFVDNLGILVKDFDASSVGFGVSYLDHNQRIMLNIYDRFPNDTHSVIGSILMNFPLDEGVDILYKQLEEGVIRIPGFEPRTEDSLKFNEEDKVDHHTVALLATHEKKWLLSINLKHHMLTLPIGKVHPDEGLISGLCREMWEELGVKLEDVFRGEPSSIPFKTSFKKTYDFAGTPVNIETYVFHIESGDCFSNALWLQAENREPEKCGGLMWVNRDDIRRIAESTGLMLADCVDAALNADMVQINPIIQ